MKYQLDFALKEKETLLKKMSELNGEMQILETSNNNLITENRNLTEEMDRKDEMFSLYAEHQARLNERVCYLEAQQFIRESRSYVFMGTRGPWVKYIRNFAHALFPEKPKNEKLTALYDVLYDDVKSFRTHVKKQMKAVLIPLARLETCRETRKHFTPWKILEVLDSSKQSLNQVSNFKTLIVS